MFRPYMAIIRFYCQLRFSRTNLGVGTATTDRHTATPPYM